MEKRTIFYFIVSILFIFSAYAVTEITDGDSFFDVNTLFIDSTNNRVGIGLTNPSESLNVSGNIGATDTISGNFVGNGSGLTGTGTTKLLGSGVLVIENTTTTYDINESNISIDAGTLSSNDFLFLEYMGIADPSVNIDVQANLHIGASNPLMEITSAISTSGNEIGSGKITWTQHPAIDDTVLGTFATHSTDASPSIQTTTAKIDTNVANVFTSDMVLQLDAKYAAGTPGAQNVTIRYIAYYLDG